MAYNDCVAEGRELTSASPETLPHPERIWLADKQHRHPAFGYIVLGAGIYFITLFSITFTLIEAFFKKRFCFNVIADFFLESYL
jgi:hypothetical protein